MHVFAGNRERRGATYAFFTSFFPEFLHTDLCWVSVSANKQSMLAGNVAGRRLRHREPWRVVARGTKTSAKDLERLMPILVVHGDDDHIVSARCAGARTPK